MSSYDLPASVCVDNVSYPIRTDFRAVLDVLIAMNDPELEDMEKVFVLLTIMLPGWQQLSVETVKECYRQICRFIDCGQSDDGKPHPRMIDWEQDAPLIMSAINGVAHTEVRACQKLHWWTFWAYFMDIGDGLLASVLNIRQKKAKHKKLEKWEKDFYKENKKLIDFQRKETEEERITRENLGKWL